MYLKANVLLLLLGISLVQAQSFQNKFLRVVTMVQPPVMNFQANLTGNNRFTGFAKDMFDLIVAGLNANVSYELYLVPDGLVGSFNTTTNTWNGMLGEIVAGQADMVLSGLTVEDDRLAVVDFSVSFLDVGLSIMVKSETVRPDMWAFLKPFAPNLWFTLFGFSMVFSVLTWLGDRITPYGKTHERKKAIKNNSDKTEPYTYSDALFSSLMIFIGKDPAETTSWGLRLIVLGFMCFSVITMANYTASLASFFTVQAVTQSPVNDISDLRFKPFGVLEATSSQQFFDRTMNIIYQRQMNVYPNWNEVLADLEDGTILAAVRDNILLEFYSNQIPCDKYLVGALFDKANYALAFTLNASATESDFVRAVNSQILKLRESGTMDSLYDSWWNEGFCSPPNEVDSRVLQIEDFVGVFTLVAILSGIGLVVLATETAFYYYYKTSKNPNLFLRSVDTFFGGKNKEQSRETTKQRNDSELVMLDLDPQTKKF